MYQLYGDGIHDDTLALQELIDTAGCELELPKPREFYLISHPLELPNNFKLKLPRFAHVKLAAGSNCVMLQNKMVKNRAERTESKLFDFINEYDPDSPAENIAVEGGVWDLNNLEQKPNPLWSGDYEGGHNGFIFLFYNVRNLRISSMTMKDTTTFAITLDKVSYFTVDNIVFDFNYGNPLAINMDGVHLNGNCHFGEISNLQGACYDDLVALNADEGSAGEISDITIRGIYSEDCHSAVRLLAAKCPVKRVRITDVYGTYFQYCVGVTKFYPSENRGEFDSITIENVFASKAERIPVYGKAPESYVYPLIYVQENLHVRALKVANLHRREEWVPVETVYVGENTTVDQMILDFITTENHTESDTMPMLVNKGEIQYLRATSLFADGEQVEL
ncbi:MAG: hypothetical protein IJB51_11610 [Clostridia bacterium]|nr:hypothetical protein [Clostridia bacterium]